MSKKFSTSELEAYLDEALPTERMAEVEERLRSEPALVEKLVAINGRRDAGVHSLGEVWRRERLSCPAREQLGSFLLGVLPEETAAYITFHLKTVGCRYCSANLADLEAQQAEADASAKTRRQKYFHSSAGYLKKGHGKS